MTELHVLICEAAARAISAFVYYECWVPNERRTRLLYAGGQSLVADNQNVHQVVEFKNISERFVWERGTGAPGRVWKLGSIEWQVDVSALPVNMFLRNSYARDANLKAMLAIPVANRLSPEFVAVGVFFLNVALEYNSRMVEKMVSVVRQLMENNSALPNISQCSMTMEPVSAAMANKLHDRRSIEVIKNILRHPVVVRTATEIRMLYDFLDGTCCLEQFTERQRWELCRGLTLRELQAGEVLYRMGEMGNESYFILTGVLKMQSMKDKSSNEHRVTVMDPELQTCILSAQHTNVFFGKKGLNGSNRAETVTALEPCDLMVMHRTDYDRCTSVNVKELTFNELAQYFHLSMNDASKELGVCVTVLKKVCRDLGVIRWPYRKVKSLDVAINDLERNLALCLSPQAYLPTGDSIAAEEAVEKAARIRIEIFDLKLQKLQLTKDMSCLNFADEVDAFGTKKAGSKSIHIMPLNYIRPELIDGSKKKSTSEDHAEPIQDPDLDHLRKVTNQNRSLPVPVSSSDVATPLGSHFGSAFSEISPGAPVAPSRVPRSGPPTQFNHESAQPFNPYFNQPFHPSNYPPGGLSPLFHPPIHTPHNSHLLYNPAAYQSNGSMLFNQNQPFQSPAAGPSTVGGPFDIQTLSAAAVLLNSLGVQTPALPEPARLSVSSIPPSVFQNLAAIFNGLAQQNSNSNLQTQQPYPSANDRSFSTGVVGAPMNGHPSQHNGFTGYNPMAAYPMPVHQYGSEFDSYMNQMNRFDTNSWAADVPQVVRSVRTSSTTFENTQSRPSPFDLPSEVQNSSQPLNKRPRLDSDSDSPSKRQRRIPRDSSEETSS